MNEIDRIALVDLDGTVADYDSALAYEMEQLRSPKESIFNGWDDVPPYIERRRHLIKRTTKFWKNLPRLKLGFEIVEELEKLGFSLHVLTKGPKKCRKAFTGKAKWVDKHLPQAALHISDQKSLVYGRILVDDFPPYFEKWLKVRPRGLVVCVAQAWNLGFHNGTNIFRYDGSNREELRIVLQNAYNRPAGP